MKKTKYYRAVYDDGAAEVFAERTLSSATYYAQVLYSSGRQLLRISEHESEVDAMVPDDGETNN